MKRHLRQLSTVALVSVLLATGLQTAPAAAGSGLAWGDGSGHTTGTQGNGEGIDDVTISPSHLNVDSLSGSVSVSTQTTNIDHSEPPPNCAPSSSHQEGAYDQWGFAKVVPGETLYSGGQSIVFPAQATYQSDGSACNGSFETGTTQVSVSIAASAFAGFSYGCYQTAGDGAGFYISAETGHGTVATLTIRDAAHPNYDCASKVDSDGDGLTDAEDNCPADPNANQADADGDGEGDVCDYDTDSDGDRIRDDADNCPSDWNADQADLDKDLIG
ncbi:MAG: hypothetical protein QOH90_751, partial [Actinomycetota bacterium]|nr:hypothetical protein [Actinomycetota bacterium]